MSKIIRPTLLVNIVLQAFLLLSLPGATVSQRRTRRPPPRPPEPLALVTQLEGSVKWQRRNQRAKSINTTTFLYAGDQIITDADGRGVVYQLYAPYDRLKPNSKKTIDDVFRPPPPDGALKPEEFAWFKIHYKDALRNQNKVSPAHMGGPDDQTLTLISPRNSMVIERDPTFEWAGIKDATKYTINLYDKKEDVVWTAVTTETRIKYSEDAKHKALPPGNYKWDVTARVGNQSTSNPALYDAADFTIATPQQADSILQDLKRAQGITPGGETTNVIYICALIQHKLYPEAEIELKKALSHSPNDLALWALLMETYNKMMRWNSREKARALITKPNEIAIKLFLQKER